MIATTAPSAALLTTDHLRQWKDELDGIGGKIEELERRRGELVEKFKAAALLIGGDVVAATVGDIAKLQNEPNQVAGRGARQKRETWGSLLAGIAREADRGLTYEEIKEEIRKSSFADRFRRSDKAFYTEMAKLDAKEVIKRHKGRVYSPEAYERHMRDVSAGLVDDDQAPKSGGREYPLATAIWEFVSGRPHGVTSSAVIAYIRGNPDLTPLIGRGTTQVYNILSRMVKQGRVVKEHGAYRAAPKRNEPPSDHSPDGSEPGPEDGSHPSKG